MTIADHAVSTCNSIAKYFLQSEAATHVNDHLEQNLVFYLSHPIENGLV